MVVTAKSINTISGKYRVLAQLGQGGTADVSLAVARGPKGFSKLVVLKSMRTQFRDEPNFAEMFMVEARLAARLSHPNIVQTNEVFDYEGLPVIVMEYLEGQTVSAVIQKTRGTQAFPVPMHLRVISECLSALDYSHNIKDFEGNEMGLVHRDVSPHNVFLTYDGQVKLLDFGIAKLNTTQIETATGVIKGKLRYMPPEQITGDAIDRRADIYAAGVMMWEAATGKKMWEGASEANIMNAVLNEEIPPPSSVCEDVAPELERIIMKAMAGDPDARYQTAAELQAELDAHLASLGSNLRVRDIGKVVSSLFAESREATQNVVNAQLARVAGLSDEELARMEPLELTAGVTGTGMSGVQQYTVTATQTTVGAKSAVGIALLGGLVGAVLLAAWQLNSSREPAVVKEPAAAVEAKDVRVRITGFPATSELRLDGEVLPSNPFARSYPRDAKKTHKLEVSAVGHETETRTVPFDQDVDLVVTLRALAPAPKSEDKEAEEAAAKAALAKPKPRPAATAPRPKAAPSVSCDPPYYIDERGLKKFKPGCL